MCIMILLSFSTMFDDVTFVLSFKEDLMKFKKTIIVDEKNESDDKIVNTILNLQSKDTLISQMTTLEELTLQSSLMTTNDDIHIISHISIREVK